MSILCHKIEIIKQVTDTRQFCLIDYLYNIQLIYSVINVNILDLLQNLQKITNITESLPWEKRDEISQVRRISQSNSVLIIFYGD